MPMPQVLVQNLGGRLGVHLPQRRAAAPAAAPTITLRNEANGIQGAVSAIAATVEDIETTLSAAVTSGTGAGGGVSPTGFNVASGTGIVAGRDYVIGPLNPDAGTEPAEVVRVRTVATNTLTLQWPLLYNHASGTPFYSTLLTYDVTAANATALFARGHAEWIWTDRAGLVQHTFTQVECRARPPDAYGLRRYPHALCSEADLFDRAPALYRKLASTVNLAAAVALAQDHVLSVLQQRYRVRTTIGADVLTDAVAWYLLAEIADATQTDPAIVTRERRHYDEAIEIIRSNATADEDEDGVVEAREGPRRAVRLEVGP